MAVKTLALAGANGINAIADAVLKQITLQGVTALDSQPGVIDLATVKGLIQQILATQPPLKNWEYLGYNNPVNVTDSSTWAVPKTGMYSFVIVGAGAYGQTSSNGGSTVRNGSGGGGCVFNIFLNQAEIITYKLGWGESGRDQYKNTTWSYAGITVTATGGSGPSSPGNATYTGDTESKILNFQAYAGSPGLSQGGPVGSYTGRYSAGSTPAGSGAPAQGKLPISGGVGGSGFSATTVGGGQYGSILAFYN